MIEVLLVTKGHPYERAPFCQMFDDMPGVEYTLVEQPAAQALFDVERASRYDAFVLYDMPGIRFNPGGEPHYAEPPEELKIGMEELLEAGKGFVFMHHAIAGWPAWERYAEIVGGRFLYTPGVLRGEQRQDSGYRHQVEHRVTSLVDHPVTRGVPSPFEITDELYLYEVFEDDVTPLLASDHEFVRDNFYSAKQAVVDRKMFSNEGWEHPDGSNLVGWCKTEKQSRVVYLQCGDDPVAYANEPFRRLLQNAIQWVC